MGRAWLFQNTMSTISTNFSLHTPSFRQYNIHYPHIAHNTAIPLESALATHYNHHTSNLAWQNSMRDQIIKLFTNGATQEDVIRMTGCSAEYISELLKDRDFVAELSAARDAVRGELIEQGYAKLEHKALNAITKEVDSNMLDTTTMLRVLETVAKNRILHRNPAQTLNHPSLNLTVEVKIPSAAQSQGITIDQKTGQIVAIGERNMSGMPIQGVKNLFKQLEQQSKDRETVQKDMENETLEQIPIENAA